MKILALDGALNGFSAAVAFDATVRASATLPGNVALERGLTLASVVLQGAGLEKERPDRIAVGIGPGSFTGLRIAIAYAKSLAQAWNVPISGVSSFDALELGIVERDVLAVVSARKGIVSLRLRNGPVSSRASGPVMQAVEEVLAHGAPPRVVIGAPKDVVDALAERGIVAIAQPPTVTPAAAAIALIAANSKPEQSVHALTADYGELPAAKVPSRPWNRA
jgi:tRNA threonylcarbamoyladenosine biosynthesis protein TsaB